MTKRAKREISLFQYILTISGVQVGFGVLTLPREVAQGKYRWLDVYYYWMCSHYFSQFMYCENYGKSSWIYFTRCADSLSWGVARKSRNDFDFICCPCSYFLNFSLLYVIHIWILPRTPMF